MYILSVHTGHNATVGLLKDGKVIVCTSEERFNRKKNFLGWPTQALAWVLSYAKIGIADVDLIVIPTQDPRGQFVNLFNPEQFYSLAKTKPATRTERLKAAVRYRLYKNPALWQQYARLQERKYRKLTHTKLEQQIRQEYAKRLDVPAKKILFIDHHFAHATSTAFNLPRNEKTLVFTLDGEGDEICASVSIFDGQRFHRIASTHKDHSLGWLYGYVTKHLGMKINEHEFKVMGLAPYAKGEHVEKAYQKLKTIISLDPHNPLVFKSKFPMHFADLYLEEEMKGVRFDNLAGGVQKLTEELIMEWVRAGIKHTGIRKVAVSGGVFMNVKANMRIAQMPEVDWLFVMPSASDESLVFGGMWYGYRMVTQERNIPFAPEQITNLYLGKEWTNEEIGEYLTRTQAEKRYKVRFVRNIEEEIARLLANGEVVARMNGRAEWGARALGNRSILANPSDFETVKLINELIKNRDFWMPFTPSMLDTDVQRYIVNPKHIPATYMCITFDSTPLAQKHLPAALHPYDKTVRPQEVIESWNPSYYKVIKAFKKLTGIGAVLNTSFNLHGEPNVNSPEDAMHTLEDSGLRNLAMGNWLVQK